MVGALPPIKTDWAIEFQSRPPESKAETERFLEIMSSLYEHPGWKIYASRVQQIFEVERNSLSNVRDVEDVQMLPVKAGRVRAIQMLLDWPLKQAQACQDALKQEALVAGSVFLPEQVDKRDEE